MQALGSTASFTKTVQHQQQKVFSQRGGQNDRMGGSVPVWEKPSNAKEVIAENLQSGLNASSKTPQPPASASSYAPIQSSDEASGNEFGFADLIDMVNPLQHIPLVNLAYRSITGDTIKPISSMIGGAVFGGPLGAAGAAVNAVVEYETGKSFEGHALSIARGEGLSYVPKNNAMAQPILKDTPEVKLAAALKNSNVNDVPELGSAMAFADLGHGKTSRNTGYSGLQHNNQARYNS
ncbi:MAG: hypothetical protein CL565_03810 [Alphaproteobacteria bacterium]|nr:hypothetical protein [Alphaproteobacteria bacterium]